MIKLLLSLLLIPTLAIAAPPTRQNSYTSQTTIRAADVSANENVIFSYLQSGIDAIADGSIVNADVAASAAIGYSKLSLTSSIVNADISSSAGIVGSKLDLSTPGIIGGTSPAAGTFTTLTGTTANLTTGNITTGNITTLKVGTTNQGDILYDNGTSIVRLTPGTSGQVLKTQGAAANPVWGAAGVNFVSNTTITAAATTGNISITNTKHYKVRVTIYLDGTTDDQFGIRLNGDTDADSEYVFVGVNTAGTARSGNATNGTSILVGASANANNNGNNQINMEFDIYPQGSNDGAELTYTTLNGKISYVDSAAVAFVGGTFSGRKQVANSTAVTSFSIISVGGETFTGNVLLYEMATS